MPGAPSGAGRSGASSGAPGPYLEDLLDWTLTSARLTPADRRLAQEITYGVARWEATLDWLIARKTGGKPQKTGLRVLLRTALYQLFWLTRIPDHAAVNETVQLAREMGFGSQAGFVNAVLRGYLRERDVTIRAIEQLKAEDPALGYSHPKWLCDRWEKRLGRTRLVQLLQWNNTPPRTFARVNLLKADPETLRQRWAEEQVEAKLVPIDWARDSLVYELSGAGSPAALPGFSEGSFYIQDPSTLLAVMELDPQPGELVLDLCAAPGGKTAFIAERMKNSGRIIAHDTTESRVALIRENCLRLGVSNVEPVVSPNFNPECPPPCDRILVDAPCSNTGVMRRRVELRWRIRNEELERLRKTQLDLLHSTSPVLKAGGILVYSTCSLEPEENRSVVDEFLHAHPEMHLQRDRTLAPWENGVDGAYVARMVKGC